MLKINLHAAGRREGRDNMQQFIYTITDEAGIHVRPAGELVKLAQTFASDIHITAGERSSSLKKLFELMGLAVRQGEEITVTASGMDEQSAIAALRQFFINNL